VPSDQWVQLVHEDSRGHSAVQVVQEQLAYLALMVREDQLASRDNLVNKDRVARGV